MKGGSASALLNNKTVLMVVAIIATLNVVGYLMYHMTHLVIIFGIIAGLTYLFANKNMILTLGVPLIAVNVLVLLHEKYGIMAGLEGMEGMDASGNRVRPRPQTRPVVKAAAVATKASKNDIHAYPHDESETTDATTSGDDVEPHTEEAFEGNTKGGRYRVDYASTIEDSYKELQDVLGSDSIKSLTADSHNLMKKQLELNESMKTMGSLVKSMAPLLNQVKGLMGAGAGAGATAIAGAPKM